MPDAGADLPGMTWLLDPERLVSLFEGTAFPVGVTAEDLSSSYLRFKPGVSAVLRVDVGIGTESGTRRCQTLWAGTYAPAPAGKVEKARQRAAAVVTGPDEPLMHVQTVPGHPGHVIAVGLPTADLKLGEVLRTVLPDDARDVGSDCSPAHVLRFNPQRRLVLSIGSNQQRLVTKICVEPAGASGAVLERLAAAGIPVLTEAPTSWAKADPRVRSYHWFGDGDLSSLSGTAAGRAGTLAGRALADLHGARDLVGQGPGEGTGDAGAWDASELGPPIDPGAKLAAMSADLRALDLAATRRFDTLATRTLALLAPVPDGREERDPARSHLPGTRSALLHGDFSTDQVLVDLPGLAALTGRADPADTGGPSGPRGHPVVITDLDRIRTGDPADDLGNLISAEVQTRVLNGSAEDRVWEGLSELNQYVLDGYRARVRARGSSAPDDRQIRAWAGFHLLMRVMSPFRNCSPTWRSDLQHLMTATEHILPKPGPGPSRDPEMQARPGDGDGIVPARIVSCGEILTVKRAWPKADGRLSAELVDSAGRIRAASARADNGRAELTWRVQPFGVDPRLPGLEALADTGRLVVHRSGRRAVVELANSYVKLLPEGRAEAVARPSEELHRMGSAAGFPVPRVLSVAPDRVEFSVLPGRSLHELGLRGQDSAYRAGIRSWARRWPDLVRGGADCPTLPQFTAQDEASVLADWVARLEAFPGASGGARRSVRETLDRVTEALVHNAPRQAGGVLHRDLHEKQVIVDGPHVGLLDFDTAAAGEPALDLANLSVHFEWHRRQGVLSPALCAYGQGAVTETAEELGVRGDRFEVYRASTRLRLGCVYAFRPRWAALAREWLAEQPV
ncbi:phosphotransferase [Kocuria sp. JC486]|uniref:phosphotransferase family protein n=1 Tax=Kocuria sp. JC486 TaxID=1970736 RepID=UPI00142390A4|nr:phosphotransferase [Kocuria sp. JC486]NHU84710.1 phosphotransferase [Kocuria sp. JC486]